MTRTVLPAALFSALLIGAWVAGMIAIAVFGVLSGVLATAVSEWIGRLF